MDGMVSDALARICDKTRAEVAERKSRMSIDDLRDAIAEEGDTPRGFTRRLADASTTGYGLIAEIKRQSPSGGEIRPGLDVAEIARAYESAGACCLSVLTDGPHFGGSLDDLKAARNATPLPVLRKDFILDPWQIFESRAAGADCILLILAALTDAEADELEELARALDMDVLAEVHDAEELQRALGLQTPLIGINNRNLKTLKTDLQTTIDLAPLVPIDRIPVSESGIRTHEDVKRIAATGSRCFLVGESLLRQPDVAAAARALLGP